MVHRITPSPAPTHPEVRAYMFGMDGASLTPEPSWELRWFVDGEPPAPLFASFQRSPEATDAEDRVDRYLRLGEGGQLVGIKIREGRFELKGRHAEICPVEILPTVHGRLEHWTKWSVEAAGGLAAFPETAWVPVRKRRSTRLWSLDGSGRATPVDQGDRTRLAQGALAELTRLELGGRQAWTFAVEAFPAAEVAAAGALEVARQMLRGTPIALSLAQAASYPSWLARRG
ncbi:MAG TPA: hypothetical protein RMF84_05570 [Polyangiaceae bacterium LLY-WYZ-14_1]|nr:hypothetical protein [Polyangiaceae bacterium LLY-WYZ-14_1]